MATRAKTPPSKATKGKKTAAPEPKKSASGSARAKSAKPVPVPTPVKKSTSKLPKNTKSKKTTEAVQPEVVIEDIAVAAAAPVARKKTAVKAAPVVEEIKDSKTAKRGRKVNPETEPDDLEELPAEERPALRSTKKSARDVVEEDDDLDDDDDEDDDEDEEGEDRPARSRKRDGKKGVRGRKRSATEEFLEEDMEETEDVEDVEILDDLDPFASTLILDPELAGPPPAPPAQLPPRPKRLAPRMQVCADCGQQYGWLSIEKVCFNCLKKRVAQRKKDEDYSGYGGSDDSGGDDDY